MPEAAKEAERRLGIESPVMHDGLKRPYPAGLGEPRDLLLCLSHLRWDFVYQRPQHLLSRAARVYQVLFLEEPLFEAGATPRLDVSVAPEGVTVATPVLPLGLSEDGVADAQRRLLDAALATIERGALINWYYTPMALAFSRHLQPDLCLYDNMDELSAFRGASLRMLALEEELFLRSDVIFTGGMSLYEAKRSRHPNVHALPSSIDADHFAQARRPVLHVPADQDEIPQPRVGFFGVIDERMDLDLVGRLAALRPEWHFVMIGPVVKIDPSGLPQGPNLHWLGGKSYQQLPAYMAGWDAGFMPFAMNEATRFISPTKTPEFLAAALPVVSTPIADVVRPYGELGLVEIAATAEEFAAWLDRVRRRARDRWLTQVDAHLATMSWDLTWSAMQDQIRTSMYAGAGKRSSMKEAAGV